MSDMFKSMFVVEPINDNLCLREPSTGVFTLAQRKVKLITDAEGNYPVNLWYTIYVLACIHEYRNNECCEPVASIFYRSFKKDDALPVSTVEHIFSTVSDEEFVPFLEEVAAAIPLHKMRHWFKLINDKLILTEEAKEAAKND